SSSCSYPLSLHDALPISGAVGDASLAQVVRRQLDTNLVTGQDADVILTHFARNMRGNDVPIFQLHAEHGVGQGVDDSAFHFEARSEEHTSELQSRENLVC